MATTPFTALRRFARIVFTLLFSGFCLCAGAAGQAPLVTTSVANGLPTPPTYEAVWQSAISSHGDFVIMDFQAGNAYQYPSNGGAWITLAPPLGTGGGYADGGIAIDQWDNMYMNSNWNWDQTAVRIPYDPVNHTWSLSNATQLGNIPGVPDYQNEGVAAGANGLLVVGGEDCCAGLWSLNVDASGNATNGQTVLSSVAGQIHALSVDNAGNIYMFEPAASPGILRIPAGTTGLPNEKGLVDVEPTILSPTTGLPVPLLSGISGMTVDSAGNLYVGDSNAGIFLVPNQGGTLNPAAWVMLTPVPAIGQLAINQARDTLFIPTSTLWNGIKDVAAVNLGNAEIGSSPVGTQSATPVTVYYSFAGSVTPARFVIQEDGVTTPDFTVVSGGTCAAGTTYPIPLSSTSSAVSYCTLNVAVNPQHLGSVSAQLLMQTSQTVGDQTVYTTAATTVLHGTGIAGAIVTTPAWESAIGGSLKTPSQVATDVLGNLYVADAGLGQVLIYPAGSGASTSPVSIGTGLTAPTGVAVDGNGDVFIADSGSVYEVPFAATGLNAAGQLTLVAGLGANLRLAVDGLGHLYVADPQNGQVVELYNLAGSSGAFGQSVVSLTSGFKAPSAVAVDAGNNLYVIDGSNLFEISNNVQSTLLTTLTNATGVAIDPSGAVYLSSSGGTVRIPYTSGALAPADQTTIATSVTSPAAVAVDNTGNVYLADAAAENVHVVSTNGSLNFGSVPLGDQPSLNATITNDGNAPLTITGYTSSNPIDYSASDGTCIGNSPIASGGNCLVDVLLAPGPGQQGTLTGQIGIQSNAADSSAVVNTTGIGAPLAISTSSLSVSASSEVVNTQVTVTVKAQNGSTVPTGKVTVSFTTVTGATGTVSGTLTNGSLTLTLSPVAAGNQNFTVAYQGDRVFGSSTATSAAIVAKSAISSLALPANPPSYLPYVLEQNGSTPYDASPQYWEYNFTVTVNAAVGQPTGTVTFMDGTSAACPAQSGQAIQPLNPSGQATFATSCLPMPQNVTYTPIVSTHMITPVYGGDANYQAFTGQTVTFIAVRSPVVAIASSPAALNVKSGSTASADLTLTSTLGYGFAGKGQQLNDYNFPVTLACSNLPPHATCSFTYPNPDPNISTAVDIPCTGTTAAADDCSTGLATVTINTNVPVGTTTSQIAQPAPVVYAAMFGLGMIGLFFRRRVGQKGRLLLMLCLTMLSGVLACSFTACSTTNLSPASVLTTPAGTYAVTITAQQVGSQVITLPTGPITIYGSQNQVSLPFTINVTVQ
jgi:hypothetical protein